MITQTLQSYRQKVTAPGSPFRFFRKAALYAKKPRESLARLAQGKELLLDLPSPVARASEELERTGFARTDDLADGSLLQELGGEITRRTAEESASDGSKTDRKFWRRLTTEADMTRESIFVRFALQPNVVKLATSYLGMVPYLSNVQVLVSLGTENKQWEDSQLWHRDYNDTKIMRFWVYLNEVQEPKQGPFTFLPFEQSRHVRNSFFPGRVADEEMDRSGLGQHAQTVYGPRLSTFAIDTARCYHMGSRVQLGEMRIAYLATFNTHTTLWPHSNGIALPQPEALSAVERLVLTSED